MYINFNFKNLNIIKTPLFSIEQNCQFTFAKDNSQMHFYCMQSWFTF